MNKKEINFDKANEFNNKLSAISGITNSEVSFAR